MARPSIGDVDRQIGKRLRTARRLRGVSQETLGAAIGVTPQSIQRYEDGQQRIACATLLEMARELDTPASDLLIGPADDQPTPDKFALRLAGDIGRVRDPEMRTSLRRLVSATIRALGAK